MQVMVRFFADNRIKQHAPLRLLRNRLFFLISLLQVYSQGVMVKAFASKLFLNQNDHSSFTAENTQGLICFSTSALVSQRGSISENCLRN
jgi:hypothetical protein